MRGVGLAPDDRRRTVRAGEPPTTRWARHEAFARQELCEQIARLFGDAKSRESAEPVPALAAAQDGIRAHVGQDGEGALPALRALMREERGPAAQVRGMP